ncbi:hypothetical protein [Mycobacterium paraffinicum]|uniref:Carotenoid biosynthesis protein n=1 Tax=Mycobacterium paraffinicum TaxID=53378 RepID=A0ABP8RK82_9MYCO|nr:hypothetical protein [Mycobacterium paraffinicum]MCV7312781.1 hypothetical protein [Mycobacterium paraffinicum]
MNAIVLNNPAGLPWQTNLLDVTLLIMFVAAGAYSVVQFRRGRRVYCAVLATATIYGLVLELAGMATLNMYRQGDFAVMINWPAFPLWHGTTMMPAYVVIFYPVFLFTGFKVIEAIGIEKRWQAAITGGLFMVALDAPYIIEGNLRHVVWWTWNPNFEYFQFWLGWPLLDLCWQGIWDAVFLYIMFWAVPRIDGSTSSGIVRWSNAKAFGAFPPLAALAVLLAGPILMSPVTVVTALGGPQWPVAVSLVIAYCAVTVTALRCARLKPSFDAFTVGVVAVYVASLGAMAIANVAYERGLTQYIVVQAVGLTVVSGFASIPWIAGRRRPAEPVGQPVHLVAQ